MRTIYIAHKFDEPYGLKELEEKLDDKDYLMDGDFT